MQVALEPPFYILYIILFILLKVVGISKEVV